jgi:hypothetical protein
VFPNPAGRISGSLIIRYRECVDKGLFLKREQPLFGASGVKNPDGISYQHDSKEAAFPESTNERYSSDQKYEAI